ncbi:MAG: DUF362 domain-containing protein [Planctomycetes bacterium]|nr:DUF362 domain-containing protein [Planctomycetota bacterium]
MATAFQSFPQQGGPLYAIYGSDPAGMAKQLLEAANAAKFIPAGATISLKPNLVVGKDPCHGATTHPEILAGIFEYLVDHGFSDLEIIEGSWVGDDTGRAFKICGMDAVARRFGAKLFDLKKDSATPIDTPAGVITVCDRALRSGFLINIPVLKGHCQTRMTCALKNMKGCIPDSEKRRFHRDGLDKCIAALATAIVPHLTIVDSICGDLDFEEGGTPVEANRMLLGADPVKIDAYACALMGIVPEEIGYLALAAKYGVGVMTVAPGDIVELNQPEQSAPMRPGGAVKRLAKHINADKACSACYANAIHALHQLERRGGLDGLPPIHIGQGWEKKQFSGVGIGRCATGCSGPAVPGCPPAAIDIVQALAKK